MKTVAEIAKKLFPQWEWDNKDEMCADIEKIAVEYALEVINEMESHPDRYMCAANGDSAVIVWKSSINDLKDSLK